MIEFPDYRALFRHLRLPHLNNTTRYAHLSKDYYEEISDNEISSETKVILKPLEKSENYKCNICGFEKKEAKSKTYKYQHYDAWHSKPAFECSQCKTKFNKKWQWAWHLKIQHGISELEDCVSCGQRHEYYKRHTKSTGRLTAFHPGAFTYRNH